MKLNEIAGSKVWVVIHQRQGAPDLALLGVFTTKEAAEKRYDKFAEDYGDDGEAPEYTYVTEVQVNKSVEIGLD